MHQYTEETESIIVKVRPEYMHHASLPHQFHYTWAYFITLENVGKEVVELIERYWHITDGNGIVQEVNGKGVVGVQPILKPGDVFEYNSGTHLNTPNGIMKGYYKMKREDGYEFNVAIPAFSLDGIEQLQRPN